MNSSMCFGSGALAEYAVIGSRPSATATGMRPSVASQSARPSLWICQCMNVVRRSITCIRYMPTLRAPVRGSRVITAGSVTNGAGSPGQQRCTGSSDEVDVVALQHDRRAPARAEPSAAARPRSTSASAGRAPCPSGPTGGCISSTSLTLRPTSSSCSTPNARHMRRSVPNWLISSGWLAPFGFSKRSAGPPALTVRSTISVISRSGSTSAVTRTSSPSRSRTAIQSRRSFMALSAGGAASASARRARSPRGRRGRR